MFLTTPFQQKGNRAMHTQVTYVSTRNQKVEINTLTSIPKRHSQRRNDDESCCKHTQGEERPTDDREQRFGQIVGLK